MDLGRDFDGNSSSNAQTGTLITTDSKYTINAGSCIVALIPEELVPAVQQAVAEQYEAKTGIKETFYVCKPSQGAGQC